MTPEQLKKLFEVLETTPHEIAANMMKLALFTGMRRGEIFKLQWNDVDFHRGFIHIRDPKSGKSQKIPLNNKARELLESIPRQKREYIFSTPGGGPYKNITKDSNKIKHAAGLPKDFRPMHGLRHLYATMLAIKNNCTFWNNHQAIPDNPIIIFKIRSVRKRANVNIPTNPGFLVKNCALNSRAIANTLYQPSPNACFLHATLRFHNSQHPHDTNAYDHF